ncbi:hypothetical protein [Massilia phyllosphaerae]|uniref:hypothetical protein n=1 Tax=Massilia phyllosphaerae TaxID=3106034 RepID=UPI002B1CB64C|nr:hypothetical protein [Massilia sp. SGZ-792]
MDNQNRRARDKRAPGTVEWDESSKPATSVPALVSPTDLHDAIMRLPCNPPGGRGAIQYNGYVAGHRDARHGAAELAASFKIAPAAADSPSTASDELHIGVSNNDQGVHINIMQRHADGTVTVIYTAKAPAGDSYGRASLAAPVAPSPLITPKHIEEISDVLLWPVTEDDARTARDMLQSLHFDLSMAEPVGAAPAAQVQADVRDVLEAAAQACEAERVEDTGTDGDTGYNNAITHCAAAIRAMKSKRAASTDGEGEKS